MLGCWNHFPTLSPMTWGANTPTWPKMPPMATKLRGSVAPNPKLELGVLRVSTEAVARKEAFKRLGEFGKVWVPLGWKVHIQGFLDFW